jgi:hypothetical protein
LRKLNIKVYKYSAFLAFIVGCNEWRQQWLQVLHIIYTLYLIKEYEFQ